MDVWTVVRFLHVAGAALWVGGQLTILLVVLPPLRRLLGLRERAGLPTAVINNAGVSVGIMVTTDYELRAVRWDAAGRPTDLGVVPDATQSQAIAVNDAGMVIGQGLTATGGRSVLWDRLGRMTLLSSLPAGTDTNAASINPRGMVAGASRTAEGELHGVLWTRPSHPIDRGTLPGGNWSSAAGINSRGDIVSRPRPKAATAPSCGAAGDSEGVSRLPQGLRTRRLVTEVPVAEPRRDRDSTWQVREV